MSVEMFVDISTLLNSAGLSNTTNESLRVTTRAVGLFSRFFISRYHMPRRDTSFGLNLPAVHRLLARYNFHCIVGRFGLFFFLILLMVFIDAFD